MIDLSDPYVFFRFLAPAFVPVLVWDGLVWRMSESIVVIVAAVASIVLGAVVSTMVQGPNTWARAGSRWLVDLGGCSRVRDRNAERAGLHRVDWLARRRATWSREAWRRHEDVSCAASADDRIKALRDRGKLYTSRYYYFCATALGSWLAAIAVVVLLAADVRDVVQGPLVHRDDGATIALWIFVAIGLVAASLARATILGEISTIDDELVDAFVAAEDDSPIAAAAT